MQCSIYLDRREVQYEVADGGRCCGLDRWILILNQPEKWCGHVRIHQARSK